MRGSVMVAKVFWALCGGWCAIAAHSQTARAECTPLDGGSAEVAIASCTSPGHRWWTVQAAVDSADVGLSVTPPSERGAAIGEWAGSVGGAVVALEAGPFSLVGFQPAGLTVGGGVQWSGAADDAARGVAAFDERGAGIVVAAEQVVPYESWMHDVVSGSPVLRDGSVISACAGDACRPMPRSAIGLSLDRRIFYAVVAEGWTEAAAGVTDPEIGELLRAMGAHDGIRTGSGATSALWSGGAVVSGGREEGRAAAAYLAVVDVRMGATGTMRGVTVDGDMVGEARLADVDLSIENTAGEVIFTGRTNATGFYMTTLPARTYILRASKSGFVSTCLQCEVAAGADRWCSVSLSRTGTAPQCRPTDFGVEAGPWPEGTPDAGVTADAGTSIVPPVTGCSCSAAVGGSAVGGSAVGGSAVGGSAVGGSAVGGSAVGGSAVGGSAVGGGAGGGGAFVWLALVVLALRRILARRW